MTQAQPEAVAGMQALHETFERNFNARTVDQMVDSCYAPDASLMPPNYPLQQGHAALRAFIGYWLNSAPMTLATEPLRYDADGDLGYSFGRFTLTITMPDGSVVEDHGKYMDVAQRQADGSWKYVADMFNSDNPPAS
jgi:ketosteroid isomerase-like protein